VKKSEKRSLKIGSTLFLTISGDRFSNYWLLQKEGEKKRVLSVQLSLLGKLAFYVDLKPRNRNKKEGENGGKNAQESVL